jgi:hypothetical protein
VELLAVLVGAGVIVGVAVDSRERPLDVLERHLLILAALRGDLLLVLPLPGRCAIMARLQLLLLMKLFCELLDLSVLLNTVALGVVH